MLPARVSEKRTVAKQPKRETRWRSHAHCDWIRRFACANCGETANVQVAHVRIGSGAGIAQKPDDWRTVPLCGPQEGKIGCHAFQHRDGERTFWAAYKANHGQSVERLIAELCVASPRAAEITRVKRERADG